MRWAFPASALVAGLAVGAALGFLGGQSDPTDSPEYRALHQELTGVQEQLGAAEERAQEAEERTDNVAESYRRSMETREAEFEQREEDLAAREEDVTAREKAVGAAEKRVAETSIGQGIWTVGVDVEPGTYRTAEAVLGQCYWGIYATGTNGADIIENDLPSGGFPTVTLREGQDFENNGCGTFVKQ